MPIMFTMARTGLPSQFATLNQTTISNQIVTAAEDSSSIASIAAGRPVKIMAPATLATQPTYSAEATLDDMKVTNSDNENS